MRKTMRSRKQYSIQELLYLPTICCFYRTFSGKKPLRMHIFNYHCPNAARRVRAYHANAGRVSFKPCACAQAMCISVIMTTVNHHGGFSAQRLVSTHACNLCGYVQRCFSKRCIFRPVAARAERKHGREIEGF